MTQLSYPLHTILHYQISAGMTVCTTAAKIPSCSAQAGGPPASTARKVAGTTTPVGTETTVIAMATSAQSTWWTEATMPGAVTLTAETDTGSTAIKAI